MSNLENPYEFIDRNAELVQSVPDTTPQQKSRELHAIENGLIEDSLSLIDMLEGSQKESEKFLNGKRETEAPFDAAIYLDKSARPVRQLVHDLWNNASDKPEPRSLFLNVDKRPWLKAMGYDPQSMNLEDITPDDVSLDMVDPEYLHKQLSTLRALYLNPADMEKIDEDNLEPVWSLPTRLDGKTIAIIDEVKSSGNTLRIALDLLKRAFPKTSFDAMWWSNPGKLSWPGGEDVDFKSQWAARIVPPWYDDKRESGRGVGDIDIPYSATSSSKAQRIGRNILSAPERDDSGNYSSNRSFSAVVRRDLGRLATRYKNMELVQYKPDHNLDDDTYDRRLEQYYGEPANVILKRWREENDKKKR